MPADTPLTWPPRREDLERLIQTHSQRQIARLYGKGRTTIQTWLAKYGLKTCSLVQHSPSLHAAPTESHARGTGEMLDSDIPLALRYWPRSSGGPTGSKGTGAALDADMQRLLDLLRRRPSSLTDLSDALDRGPTTIRGWIDDLRSLGYLISQRGELWGLDKEPVAAEVETSLPKPVNGVLRIGVVSDTHLGSKHQQLTYLRETYRRFEDAGAQEVYHCGDLLDGVDVYRGQHAQQFLHTYDEQIDYAVAYYPRSSLTTKVIGGNHDLAGVKRGDSDPLRRIASERPDIEYLGPYSAWPQLGQLLFYLLHPDGPPAYAISYKLQKIVESFEGGRKPHVLVVGHWHQMAYVHTRNVHAFYPGTFQAQTEYERRRALQPQIGALLLTVRVAEDGSWQELTPTFYRYYVPRQRDYESPT